MNQTPADHSAPQPASAPNASAAPSAPAAKPAATPPVSSGAKKRARKPAKRSSHSKLIIPFLSAGLLVAGGAMIVREIKERPMTASAVMRDLRDLALQRGVVPGQQDGGELGPWWISAASYDPMSGELKNFRLKSGPIELAAATAKILVDPETDSIGFELWRVVYAVLPNDKRPEQVGELIEMEGYTLGPVPFGHEIVPDSDSVLTPPTIPPRTTPNDTVVGVTH